MLFKSILTPELTFCHPIGKPSKKHILELISNKAGEANHRIRSKDILFALTEREQLGNTAIGNGIAIPHARIKGLKNSLCILISLEQPIDFGEENLLEQQADLIFALLVPEDATQDHIDILAELSKTLKNVFFRDHLRKATSDQALFEAATEKN